MRSPDMRVQTIAGIALALLVCGYSPHSQDPTTPSPQVRRQVDLTAVLVSFSPSAKQLGLKEYH